MFRNREIVPVLMFHSVGLQEYPWSWNFLSQPLETFEGFLEELHTAGFQTVGLQELNAHMRGDVVLRNAIVLTFDDGYLDNWVYVAPILRKHKMRGTVFVNPDFIDPTLAVRSTLEDVWQNRCGIDELQPAGFMNWEELRRLDNDGVLNVQSHAMTHTWHFTGPQIVGWHKGERLSRFPWLAWNALPERKPYYLAEDQSSFVPAGHPVFENRQALVAKRFFPDESLISDLVNFVSKNEGKDYFRRKDWEQGLNRIIKGVESTGSFPGQWESELDREARVRYEISQSRAIIGRELGKSVDYICWPAGGSDEFCERTARECGYLSWTLRSRQLPEKRNLPYSEPSGIRRMGIGTEIKLRGRFCGSGSPKFHLARVLAHQGSYLSEAAVSAYTLAAFARSHVRKS